MNVTDEMVKAAFRDLVDQGYEVTMHGVREALSAALAAGAPGVKVKALEWEPVMTARSREDPTPEETGDCETVCAVGVYYIEMYFGSDSYGWRVTLNGTDDIADKDDPEAAKAAAQADYEARILSALEPAPSALVAEPGEPVAWQHRHRFHNVETGITTIDRFTAPVQPEPPHSTVFRVEQDGTGLFIGTSPQFHGLLVAKTSLLEAIRAIPDALEALILASPVQQAAPSGGFPRDDFTHTANLLRSGDEAVIKATLSNNLNVIIAALDRAAVPSGEGE